MARTPGDIYQISRSIAAEEEQKQAREIINAYRKVEGLRLHQPPNQQKTQVKTETRSQPTSKYAQKVKQTLQELTANRAKEQQALSKHSSKNIESEARKQQWTRLEKAGVSKLVNVLQDQGERVLRTCLREMRAHTEAEVQKQAKFLRKYRLYKLFRAWKDEVVLIKIQKQRKGEADLTLATQRAELVKAFRAFQLTKKALNGWRVTIKKEIKKRQYERELRKKEIEQKAELQRQQKQPVEKKVESKNNQLQSKLKGFLDGLKGQIENKLHTIKQKTQESQMPRHESEMLEPMSQRQQEEEYQQSYENEQFEQEQEGSPQRSEGQQRSEEARQQDRPAPTIYGKKAVTNDELQQKRQQLEAKHKSRKAALEKLRKDKEGRRAKEQQERVELQKEVEAEQKRKKQEQYRLYVRRKQEEEQWHRKEKDLTERAIAHNRRRLLYFYGWMPLKTVKQRQYKKAESLYQTLLLIVYRVKATRFIQNVEVAANQQLQQAQRKVERRRQLQTLKKVFAGLRDNCKQELERKEELQVRHQVNALKIFLSAWKRIMPSLALQNFDWQRPRNLRAAEFHRLQLLHKAVEALKQHRQEEQRSRSIARQKAVISQKIKGMLQPVEIDYEQFL